MSFMHGCRLSPYILLTQETTVFDYGPLLPYGPLLSTPDKGILPVSLSCKSSFLLAKLICVYCTMQVAISMRTAIARMEEEGIIPGLDAPILPLPSLTGDASTPAPSGGEVQRPAAPEPVSSNQTASAAAATAAGGMQPQVQPPQDGQQQQLVEAGSGSGQESLQSWSSLSRSSSSAGSAVLRPPAAVVQMFTAGRPWPSRLSRSSSVQQQAMPSMELAGIGGAAGAAAATAIVAGEPAGAQLVGGEEVFAPVAVDGVGTAVNAQAAALAFGTGYVVGNVTEAEGDGTAAATGPTIASRHEEGGEGGAALAAAGADSEADPAGPSRAWYTCSEDFSNPLNATGGGADSKGDPEYEYDPAAPSHMYYPSDYDWSNAPAYTPTASESAPESPKVGVAGVKRDWQESNGELEAAEQREVGVEKGVPLVGQALSAVREESHGPETPTTCQPQKLLRPSPDLSAGDEAS